MTPVKKKSWVPSRKWGVAQVASISGWAVAAINAGWHIGASLQIMAVTIVAGAVSTYIIPNKEDS